MSKEVKVAIITGIFGILAACIALGVPIVEWLLNTSPSSIPTSSDPSSGIGSQPEVPKTASPTPFISTLIPAPSTSSTSIENTGPVVPVTTPSNSSNSSTTTDTEREAVIETVTKGLDAILQVSRDVTTMPYQGLFEDDALTNLNVLVGTLESEQMALDLTISARDFEYVELSKNNALAEVQVIQVGGGKLYVKGNCFKVETAPETSIFYLRKSSNRWVIYQTEVIKPRPPGSYIPC